MDKIISIISNQTFLTAVCSMFIVIIISYILRRTNVIKQEAAKVISNLVLKLSLPCLAFNAFMTDLKSAELKSNFQMFIVGFIVYGVLVLGLHFLFKVIMKNTPSDKKSVYALIITFGNVTFFTMPILNDYYGAENILIPQTIMILFFRIFIYSYAYFVMAGIKIEKNNVGKSFKNVFLNPIVIATFLGLIIWATQNFCPKFTASDGLEYSIFRLDKSIPILYKSVTYLSSISSPLSWVLIGVQIGEMSIKEAFNKKDVWILSLLRILGVPLLVLLILTPFQYFGILSLTKYGFAAAVLTMSAPLSIVINTYSVKYNKEPFLVSDTCLVSSILGMISVPVLIVLVEFIWNTLLV